MTVAPIFFTMNAEKGRSLLQIQQKKNTFAAKINKRETIMSKMRFFALQELANRRPLEVNIPSNK